MAIDAKRTAAALTKWFRAHARDLPWRTPAADPGLRRDPYTTLVSELMLQQTQVSRVLEKYEPFLERFPTMEALATADEADVLAEWSGLGYYRRARLLHAAAKAIVESHDGVMPREARTLRTLPGIGEYTAGAIASLCFREAEPAADGNVIRVALRLHGADLEQTSKEARALVHDTATDLVRAADDPGDLNESLIELGATVCTPANPKCGGCPIADGCRARLDGLTDVIPRPKKAIVKTPLWCAAVVVRDPRARIMVERRPDSGLWAGMWQAPTIERAESAFETGEVADHFGLGEVRESSTFKHQTTHRDVSFQVYEADAISAAEGRVWKTVEKIEQLALSNPQRRILLGR